MEYLFQKCVLKNGKMTDESWIFLIFCNLCRNNGKEGILSKYLAVVWVLCHEGCCMRIKTIRATKISIKTIISLITEWSSAENHLSLVEQIAPKTACQERRTGRACLRSAQLRARRCLPLETRGAGPPSTDLLNQSGHTAGLSPNEMAGSASPKGPSAIENTSWSWQLVRKHQFSISIPWMVRDDSVYELYDWGWRGIRYKGFDDRELYGW